MGALSDAFDEASQGAPTDVVAPPPASLSSAFDEVSKMADEEKKREVKPAEKKDLPWHERLVQGIKDPFNASAQLLMHSPMTQAHFALQDWIQKKLGSEERPSDMIESLDTSVAAQEKAYQEARGKDASIDWWRGAGNVANPINWIGPAGGASSWLARLGANALRGAAGATLSTPVTEGSFATEKTKQAALGAVGGAILTPVASGLARMVQPETQAAAKTLLKEGVTPTPGQIMGGTAQRLEDAATSIPLLGDMIKNAQGKALAQFNTAAYQRALDPIGEKAPNIVGREGVEKVASILGNRYDTLLSGITFRPDGQFAQDLQGLRHLASGLPEAQGKQFDNILKTQLGKATGAGTMDGETLKGVLSEIRREAKGYSGDASFDNRKLGSALDELHGVLTSTLQRINPDKAAELKALDTGWANYARIRHAAAAQGAHDGVFTPAQLSGAVKAQDKSVGKGDFAKGKALMQDLSEAGKSVLSQKVPDSGTPLRALLAAGLAGGGGYLANTHPLIAAGTAAGIGLGSAAYTQKGRQAIAALLTKRPDLAPQIAQAIRRGLPSVAGPASGTLLRDMAPYAIPQP